MTRPSLRLVAPLLLGTLVFLAAERALRALERFQDWLAPILQSWNASAQAIPEDALIPWRDLTSRALWRKCVEEMRREKGPRRC